MPGYITRGDREPLGGLFAYNGTQGHVDRPASRDRAENEARGEAVDRSLDVLKLLRQYPLGLTWKDVADHLGYHHGQASGTLSNLHKSGRVFMLSIKRGKSHPYVHADYRDQYTPSERFDTPAQTRAGKTREIEREIIDAILAEYGRGYSIADNYIHSLVEKLIAIKEGNNA